MFDPHLIQASLLQSYFGLFCGSQKLFQQSESIRGSLVTACKRMHLLRPGVSAVEELRNSTQYPLAHELEKAVLQDERRVRLGWGIYVSGRGSGCFATSLSDTYPFSFWCQLFDAQLACLLNLPAQLSVSEILAPLPSPPSVSNESVTDPFRDTPSSKGTVSHPLMFPRVLKSLLDEGRLMQELDELGYSIVSHTLYR
jgi:hypothetical protein